MITFIGILLLIAAAVLAFIGSHNSAVRKYNAGKEDSYYHKQEIGFSLPRTAVIGFIIAGFLLVGFGVANPFSINSAEERQVVQTIGGDLSVRFEPGLYFAGFFSTITTYPNNVTIQVGPENKRSSEADYWEDSHTCTFSEGDQANAGHTVKWDLPNKEPIMIELHTTYSGINNLMKTTLLQYQKETMNYSSQRMSSEAHYSGGQSQLKEFFQDQLRNGQVLLVTETKTQKLENGTEKTYIEVREKQDASGNIIRTISDIQKYELIASFSSIDFIKYDERIYEKLKAKIDAAADEATAKQEGRAQAAANLALVKAGLTPVEKAEWEYKTAVGVAEQLSKAQMPGIVISGSEGGADPLSAVGIKYLMDINDKLGK